MFGMNRYKILKCFIKEKHNCRRAFLSGDRSFLPMIPNKSTRFIKLPHKMIVYIINKDHICKFCMCMYAFEKQSEFNNFQF